MPSVEQEEVVIIREGWLIKSPAPWKMKLPGASWTTRYFVLSSSPGRKSNREFNLDYYQDETKKKKHGGIKVTDVVQVDSYLTYEAGKNRVYKWIFDVQLSKRQIFLVANDEQDMNDWVNHLCSACQLEKEDPQYPDPDGPDTDTPQTPDELANILNDTRWASRNATTGRRESETPTDSTTPSTRLHQFFFAPTPDEETPSPTLASYVSPHHQYNTADRLPRSGRRPHNALLPTPTTPRTLGSSNPCLPTQDLSIGNNPPRGYLKLQDFVSGPHRAGYNGPFPQVITPQRDDPPSIPAPVPGPTHSRGISNDSTNSFPLSHTSEELNTTSDEQSASLHSLNRLGSGNPRSGSFGAKVFADSRSLQPGTPTSPFGSHNGITTVSGSSSMGNVLDAVVPPPPRIIRPAANPHNPSLYTNETERPRADIPFGYDRPPTNPQNIFGSLNRDHKDRHTKQSVTDGPASLSPNNGATQQNQPISSGGFNSLPRMPRSAPSLSPSQEDNNDIPHKTSSPGQMVTVADTIVQPPHPSQLGNSATGRPTPLPYTAMTNKIAFYEPMSTFSGIPPSDEEEEEEEPKKDGANDYVTISKSKVSADNKENDHANQHDTSITSQDSNLEDYLPPRPPNKNAQSVTEPPESEGESYLNFAPLNTPVNMSSNRNAPASAPPPVPDRSLKPTNRRDGRPRGWSQSKEPPLPVKSGLRSSGSTDKPVPHSGGWKVEKRDSFVRRGQTQTSINKSPHSHVIVPKHLPKTSVAPRTGPHSPRKQFLSNPPNRKVSRSESELCMSGSPASSSSSAAISIPRSSVNYIEIDTGTSPLARQHSPALGSILSTDESDASEQPSVKYADISLNRTRAVKDTLNRREHDISHSLDRKALRKPTGRGILPIPTKHK